MMRAMRTVQHPLVLRRGMRPVGYGDASPSRLTAAGGGGTLTSAKGTIVDAYKAAYPNGLPCLSVGARDISSTTVVPLIKAVAETLDNYNYGRRFDLSGGLAGSYDAGMKRAIEDFQSGKGLTVDGVVGPDTWKVLVNDMGMALSGIPAQKCGYSRGGGGSSAGTGAGAGVQQVRTDTKAESAGASLTDKAWFWPVAILVPTAAVIGGILFWPKKKSQ
jgi:peptidoglycan hydrolase-like protein with peptidoglycan-binding domain